MEQAQHDSGGVFAVRRGRVRGVLDTWNECERSVSNFPMSEWRIFPTRCTAEQWLVEGDHKREPGKPGPPLAVNDNSNEAGARKSSETYEHSMKHLQTGGVSAKKRQKREPSDAAASCVWGRKTPFDSKGPTSNSCQEVIVIDSSEDEREPIAAPRGAKEPDVTERVGTHKTRSTDAKQLRMTEEQILAVEHVKAGRNVFFTGNAGTGKSFTMSCIVAELQQRYVMAYPRKVAITASTGIAATHIGGTTLHSCMGIGVPRIVKDFQKMGRKARQLRDLEVLIIDELSMVSATLFFQLSEALKTLRSCSAEFGGLQLICCGDYFQLPPIEKRHEASAPPEAFFDWGMTFQAPSWAACNFKVVVLSKVFRQRNSEFVSLLNRIRCNLAGQAAMQQLVQHCSRPLPPRKGIRPTELYARNQDVDRVNTAELAALPGGEEVVKARDVVQREPAAPSFAEEQLRRHSFWRDCLASEAIALKVGAQVMLLKNLDLDADDKLVNGSRGVVTAFVPKDKLVQRSGTLASMVQVHPDGPPKPLDELLLGSFERMPQSALQAQLAGKLLAWPGRVLPLVRFMNDREGLVLPSEFTVKVFGSGECIRTQLPLKLAWAITIHKCQGMTLDYVKISLRNIFTEGQAYVALSRASSLEGLQILDWSPDCVRTSPTAVAFWQTLLEGQPYHDGAWEARFGAP